ncbi:hypothetical protein LTR08_004730 [Meristemomyces frigidus]|nr:hypothetical protein LTR08_004730 [Meristemomyces frigidus]
MANYSQYCQIQNWMAMSSNYPPPQPEQLHYNGLYPMSAGAQQLLDHGQQEHLDYNHLNTHAYPKIESGSSDQPAVLLHNVTGIDQHAALEEQQRQHIQQAAQQIHQHAASQVHPSTSFTATNVQHQHSISEQTKSNRLRKACDSCSIRKVKCDESAAAEGRPIGMPMRSSVDEWKIPWALSSHASAPQLSAESICPIETVDLLIDDFFTYIHPLCPFPHEPSFREAWKRREDLSNKSFLALLASMIGALVSSFPRKPRLHLKAARRESLFPNHMSLVNRCQQVCALARGPGYLESENLSVYDAATSYFLALMGVYTFRWRLGRLYFGECLTIIRTLGIHKATYTQFGVLPPFVGSNNASRDSHHDQPPDNITVEMGRRIFWTMFVSAKTIQQLGASFSELFMPPATPNEPYPPLPAEIDDFCIYPTHNEAQPPGLLPIIAGFNANVKVYRSYDLLATMELARAIDSIVDWEGQKRVVHESLQRCKHSIAELPHDLTIYPNVSPLGHLNQQNGASFHPGFAQPNVVRDPALNPSHVEQDPEERRRMQYEIQKANIYASSLATRSYVVEKYFNLCEAHERLRSRTGSTPSPPRTGVTAAGLDGMLQQPPTSRFDTSGQEMRQEREDVVKDLLMVLSSINQVNMEPNADSFTMKIRSIASTLLESPDQRKGQLALQTQEYLSAFLKILMKLERVSPANSNPDLPDDEEAELRAWADLRDYQLKFAQQGGILGMS